MVQVASQSEIVCSILPLVIPTSPEARFLDFESDFILSRDSKFNVPPGDRTISDLVDILVLTDSPLEFTCKI